MDQIISEELSSSNFPQFYIWSIEKNGIFLSTLSLSLALSLSLSLPPSLPLSLYTQKHTHLCAHTCAWGNSESITWDQNLRKWELREVEDVNSNYRFFKVDQNFESQESLGKRPSQLGLAPNESQGMACPEPGQEQSIDPSRCGALPGIQLTSLAFTTPACSGQVIRTQGSGELVPDASGFCSQGAYSQVAETSMEINRPPLTVSKVLSLVFLWSSQQPWDIGVELSSHFTEQRTESQSRDRIHPG